MVRLTKPQIKRLARARDAQFVSGARKKPRVAERPNRRPRGARPSRRPAGGAPVAATQSYLNVDRC